MKKADTLVMIGAIINIVIASILTLTIIGAALGVPTIIANANVLKGKSKSQKKAAILGIICSVITFSFLPIAGGILMLVGKYEEPTAPVVYNSNIG